VSVSSKVSGELAGLRAKAKLYDELVDALAHAEEELERLREQPQQQIDPAWRQIASELAGALRPYTMFREQRIADGRVIIETAVPGSTLTAAKAALGRLAAQLALESFAAEHMTSGCESQPSKQDGRRLLAA
jgi:hypothetical protein